VHPIEPYLEKLAEIRASGHATDETSYYPAIEALLAELGKPLKPRVVPVLQLKNRGAGLPDGGLFTQDQLRKNAKPDDFTIQPPNRGVVEVKGLGENLDDTIKSEQVAKYVRAYGQVLLTNYREFRIVIGGDNGKPRALETLTLAKSEVAFWGLAAHPRKAADAFARPLEEFLKRALMSAVPIQTPDVLASFLASYAREALAKIEPRFKLKELEDVRGALEEALGLKFDTDKGEHFFRSTLVQTLFYGLFSAWVLWYRAPERRKGDRFDWRLAVWSLQVPMIRALYERLVIPAHVRSLGLEELLNLTGEVLNRVNGAAFFERFEESTAVQYFYEPFLEAFDPELRKQLGVWYTPREIVRYMVKRVDRVLRSELGIASGLADPNVYVLDPACGTGAYVVEVLERIHKTLVEERGEDALTPHQLKQAAKERVFGFEILPAPFVISHLQIGMFLQRAHAPLESEAEGQRERAGVFLTNSLTGWEPPDRQKARLPFEEFEREREEADSIKQREMILVVLGNPPYNAFAGVSPSEEDNLVKPYKEGLISEWGIKKFNLDDLYVRFFRLAERRIAEKNRFKRGVVAFISNMSWVREPSFVVLRKHLLQSFDRIWIENLHGNRKISEYAPDGCTSETVFAVDGFSPGIQQGVATTLWVRKGGDSPTAAVLFRDDLNAAKAGERRRQLLSSLDEENFDAMYEPAAPAKENRYSFWPHEVSTAYGEWPKLIELCAEPPSNGLMEKRGGALIDMDRAALEAKMRTYHDRGLDWDAYRLTSSVLTDSWAGFDPKKMRARAVDDGFHPANIVRYAVRPFDTRWCYYSSIPSIWNRSRPPLWAQSFDGNEFLLSRMRSSASPEGFPISYTRRLSDDHYFIPDGVAVPFALKHAPAKHSAQGSLDGLFEQDHVTGNLSGLAISFLGSIDLEPNKEAAAALWHHALAIGYSPAYLEENADGIRGDWPRIPLPALREQFLSSAAFGTKVANLLDTEQPVQGVTAGVLRTELRGIAALARFDGKPLEPGEDFVVTAGWGHGGKEGVTMPGRGKLVRRERSQKEHAELVRGISAHGLSEGAAIACLGSAVVDVYLNDRCAWTGIPEKVWELYIGGYQVIKKWLSYREFGFLKRLLTLTEVEEVQAMARRLTALCLLQPQLDANYEAVKANTWKQVTAEATLTGPGA
jgi:hypothetical protein